MDEPDSGFSFNADIPPSEPEEDLAVEVAGEPVSRKEAKKLGIDYVADTRDKDVKSSSNILRMEQLPPGIGSDLAAKMERAWAHLRKNEIEQALTLAQEVVWEYPALVSAKLIIARCFINRKEYEKALNILQAISETEVSAETMYYIGLCHSRLGHVKDAIASLTLCKASSTDSLTRKKATDLLNHLQGEQITCPVCGKKVLYDSLVEVGNRTVCANCAKREDTDDGDSMDFDDDLDDATTSGKRKKKKLRVPLTKGEILLRVVFGVMLLVVGLYVMYMFFPATYSNLRNAMPFAWGVLPEPSQSAAVFSPPPQHAVVPEGPRVVPTMVLDSPPIERVIAGVPLRHRLYIEGMEDRDGVFSVIFEPEPTGPYFLNEKSGEFTWTPADDDAGKTFTVTFDALYRNLRSRDQVNEVRVSPGLITRKLGSWPAFKPDNMSHIFSHDFTGDENEELVLVSGDYWTGQASIAKPDEPLSVLSTVELNGRPVGAGVIVADGENWLAVADYTNSRIRYFAYRDGSLAEMAVAIDLPGAPLLADFSADTAVSVVLCRVGDRIQVLAFRQDGQLRYETIGEWNVSDQIVWRRLLVFGSRDGMEPTTIILSGIDPDASLFMMQAGDLSVRATPAGIGGVLAAAEKDEENRLIHMVIKQDDDYFLAVKQPLRDSPAVTVASAGNGPILCGMTSGDLSGNGGTDFAVFSTTKVGLSLGNAEGNSETVFWDLETSPRLFGRPTTVAGGISREAIFVDLFGDIWSTGVED